MYLFCRQRGYDKLYINVDVWKYVGHDIIVSMHSVYIYI